MENIKQEFQALPINQDKYAQNFESSCGIIPRKLFLFHTLQYLVHVKNQLLDLESKNNALAPENLKEIRAEDSTAFISRKIAATLGEVIQEKGEGEQIDEDDIVDVILRTFKTEFIGLVFMFLFDSLCRLTFSVVIVYLLQAVAQHKISTAYTLCSALLVVWYLSQLFKQGAALNTQIVLCKMKAGLAMLLYAKISTLTSYSIKSSHIGRISNLLSNDLAAIQHKIGSLTSFLILPILLVGYTIIMVIRIGWSGFIGTVMTILLIPIASKVSKLNGEILKEANVFKDKRVQVTTETIEGIRYVKLYGWEIPFRKTIQQIREKQLSVLRKLAIGKAFERALGYFISVVASLVMIVVATYAAGIEYKKVFSVLEIMSALKMNVLMFTEGTGYFYELKVIFERFASIFNIKKKSMIKVYHKDFIVKDQFNRSPQRLKLEQIQQFQSQKQVGHKNYQQDLKCGDVKFNNFNGFWNEDFSSPFLKNINLVFQTGKLYGITGKVGSGKSALLGAILGQLPYYSGELLLKGSVAYVQQEPVAFSTTIRKNIIFGKQFNQAKYDYAVKLSCLDADFGILPHGDQTVVGEKGTTLSGGQKARLALARAIYSDADIFLLDDPISAVDAKVGKRIFEQCIRPLSMDKTVILATHQVSYLRQCDQSIILEDGQVFSSGNPQQIEQHLQYILQSFKEQHQKSSNGELEEDQQKNHICHEMVQTDRSSHYSQFSDQPQANARLLNNKGKLQGDINLQTYMNFFFSVKSNYFLVPFAILLHIATEASVIFYTRFLGQFDSVKSGRSSMFSDMRLYWQVLALLLVFYFVFLVVQYYLLNDTILKATEHLHNQMLEATLRSPASFFDETSSGSLMNKFSNDLGIVDRSIVTGLNIILTIVSYFFVTLANLCQINPIFIVPSIIFMIATVMFYTYARPAIIGCRKLDLQKKNPIFNFFSQTISGLTQIRVYHRKKDRIRQFSQIINTSTKTAIGIFNLARGFGFFQTIFSIILLGMGMYLGIIQSNTKAAHLYGVTILLLTSISELIRRLFRETVLIDCYMVSAQRILGFQDLKSEKDFRNDYDKTIGLSAQVDAAAIEEDLHIQWPRRSVIQIRNLTAKYKASLPPVLKSISFTAKEGEKVGIVGRTGAGKSSIANALFRTFQPQEGSVYRIDQHNALEMGLHSLRQHISVIPQFPFVFKGTIKKNLDPFETASEERLWEALEKAGLSEQVAKLQDKMDTVISNNSATFSVGQKQLLCLARALLRKNKFLVLDEATANVDMQTDALIQKVIRESFAGTTVITIAHRLDTIVDYDKILVMSKGRVVEAGSPYELIEKKGEFFRMVQHAGKNAEVIINRARKTHFKTI